MKKNLGQRLDESDPMWCLVFALLGGILIGIIALLLHAPPVYYRFIDNSQYPQYAYGESPYYQKTHYNNNIGDYLAKQSIPFDKTIFCNSGQYGCVLHDKTDYLSHGLDWKESDEQRSLKNCGELFCR